MTLGVGEHDDEPIPGLPGRPPEGERVLWQGGPDWRAFARHAFHTRKVSVYFALLTVWSVISGLHEGAPLAQAVAGVPWLAGAWALALGVLWTLSWAMCRTAIYTITTKRVVFRFGVAIQKAINVPFSRIANVAMRARANGLGDVSIDLTPDCRLGFLIVWPHTRPFRFSRPEPTLRCVPDVAEPARILSRALEAAGHGVATAPNTPATTDRPGLSGESTHGVPAAAAPAE